MSTVATVTRQRGDHFSESELHSISTYLAQGRSQHGVPEQHAWRSMRSDHLLVGRRFKLRGVANRY